MLELILACALIQDPPKPPMPPPPPGVKGPQDPHRADVEARMNDLKRKLDSTEDPEERERIMDEIRELKMQMGHPGPKMPMDLSPEKYAKMEEEALAFLKESSPAQYAEIQRAKEGGNKDAYKGMIFEAFNRAQMLKKLKEVDPKAYDLEVKLQAAEDKSRSLGDKIRTAKDNDTKEDTKRELRTVLAELFDLREQRQQRDIENLQKEIQKLNDRLKSRRASKDKIVDKRLSEMVGEAENLDW